MNVHRQSLEHVFLKAVAVDPRGRTGIDTPLSCAKGRDILVHAHLCNAEELHLYAVVTAKAVVGAEPHKAILILYDVAHGIGRQSVVHRDATIAALCQ